jgi:catechol 2,3-dioxygenase-like lactoylglutathione lyase family enzyme
MRERYPVQMLVRVTLAFALALGPASASSPLIAGIDHVPVAVSDLEKAGEQYRTLGFTLKPGRPHDNGIRNVHAKFADGTEIELITAPAATDALTRTYREHLKAGDGPAFLALFAPPGNDPERRAKDAGVPVPSYMFFGPRQASPTDRPEHFVHANSAYAVTRVWLAGDDLSAERRLLAALGGRIRRARVHFPTAAQAEIAEFPQGSVALLPGRSQIVPGRPIVGITVAVRDLDVAAKFAGVGARRTAAGIFVEPQHALGYWLEFRR